MLAIFFIDVCIFLVRAYPAESEALSEFFHNYNAQKSTHWLAIEEGIFYMEGWDNHSHDPIFTIHKQLLTTALQKITTKDGLPLLSTPTHEPVWIHPETLVKRILLYEKDGKNIFNIDAQVAFSRCLLTDTANAISLVEKQLTGEYKNLLLFLFGKHKQPLGPFENMAAWICCSVALKEKKTYKEFEGSSFYKKSFANYTGRFSWQSVDEEYLVDRYDHSAQKMVKHTDRRKIIRIQIDRSVSKESTGLKKFFSSLLQKPKAEPLLIYDLLEVKGEWVTFENDGRRLTMLFPNNPEPFLAIITNRYLSSPIFFSESYKKTVIPCQQALFEIWEEPGEMAYLFLGTCMLSPDKTIINIAGETWIKAVNIGKMNNEMLGHIIGSHERIEFAPLKRFTDMVSQVLYNISATHNKNLRSLLESILIELPDSPIKNIKKLLELYYELCSAQDHVINDARLQVKLNMWETNTGLQKIIKMLREQEL